VLHVETLVIFTGAGISAESGLQTFRGAEGLWEGHRIEDVATAEAWSRNRALVQEFYNQRRRSVLAAEPNAAHRALVELDSRFDTWIVTQNIDDLHERAGSARVLHLHGEIRKSQSSLDPARVYDIDGSELREGMLCEGGSQLRPHVVWFGEPVPMIGPATALAERAAHFVVIGTSLQVYPAASLLEYVPANSAITLIDPSADRIACPRPVRRIAKTASAGVPEFVKELCSSAGR